MKLNETVKIPKHVVFQKVGDETVLLNMESGVYYGLNSTGTRLWEVLRDKKNLRAALDELVTEYDVQPQDLQRDVLRLIRELEAKGLIEVVES
jgi:hypothetical protein